MNILSNIGKSAILATCIFWVIILTNDFDWDFVPFIFLSVIPIYICCSLTILITICPIFWFIENNDFSKQRIFKTYFPIYTILIFGFCAYGIYKSSSEIFILSFYISVYITTAQSWVWFAKEKIEIR